MTQVALLRVCDDLYEAAANDEAWPTALRSLSELLDTDGGHFASWDKLKDTAVFAQTSRANGRLASEYAAAWGKHDPSRLFIEEASPSNWVLNHKLLASEDFVRLPYNNEFLFASGYRYVAKLQVRLDPSRRNYDLIGFVRSATRAPFDEQWIRRVDRQLTPHFKRAAKLRAHLVGRNRSRVHELALVALQQGVLITDTNGRVLFLNPAAEGYFTKSGLSIRGGRLRSRDTSVDMTLKRLISSEPLGGVLRLPSGDLTADDIVVSISPLPEAVNLDCMAGDRCMLVLVSGTHQRWDNESLVLRIQELYSLTRGEARLAALVGRGLEVKNAAQDLGQAYETARTVLKRIFSKMGIQRQGELVALIGRISATLPFM